MQNEEIQRLFKSYPQPSSEYNWYRRIKRCIDQKQFDIESAVEVQKRGGPDAIQLCSDPSIFIPSTQMQQLIVALSNEHTCESIYNIVLVMIQDDYSNSLGDVKSWLGPKQEEQ